MHFKIETISALPTRTLATKSYGYALTGRVESLSANHPPVAPHRLQAYRDTARSLGYPLAVVSLHRLDKKIMLIFRNVMVWIQSMMYFVYFLADTYRRRAWVSLSFIIQYSQILIHQSSVLSCITKCYVLWLFHFFFFFYFSLIFLCVCV